MTTTEAIDVNSDPWRISLEDFQRLPPDDQERLRQRAILEARSLVLYHFLDAKHYWILLCGDRNRVHAVAVDEDGVLSADTIAFYEQSMDRPAYGIFRLEITGYYLPAG